MTSYKQALELVGGLSRPSKMPGFGYSIPAQHCKIGSILAKIKGTVCSGCYALKGRYVFPAVQAAMQRRYNALSGPKWVEAMALVLNYKNRLGKHPHFRWHDSGDIQSLEHLEKIIEVCRLTPQIKHWLPTRERGIIKQCGDLPKNLCIRLSATRIGDKIDGGMPTSMVIDEKQTIEGVKTCPAPSQRGKCLDCRSCWDPYTTTIAYVNH